MTRLTIVLFAVLLGLSAGCASTTKYWYQEGKTFEQCYEDHRVCYEELVRLSAPSSFGDHELNFIEDCMKSKGYRLVPEDRLPYPTKTLGPNRSIHRRLRGLAGRPDDN
jgi:hypothetical protein